MTTVSQYPWQFRCILFILRFFYFFPVRSRHVPQILHSLLTHLPSLFPRSFLPPACPFTTSNYLLSDLPRFLLPGSCISSTFLPTSWTSSRRFTDLSLHCLTFCPNLSTFNAPPMLIPCQSNLAKTLAFSFQLLLVA